LHVVELKRLSVPNEMAGSWSSGDDADTNDVIVSLILCWKMLTLLSEDGSHTQAE
ncbi:SPX and EXS domain-containing protein 2, partial [Clarias magur]